MSAKDEPNQDQRIEDCVEALCQRGCSEVLDIIDALERGEPMAETDALGEAGRAEVCRELKAVMSVYGNVCRA